MADIAELGLKVDSGPVRTGQSDLKKFGQTAGTTEKRVNSATRAIKQFASALAIGATMRSVINATIEQERVTAQLEQTLKSTGRYTPELSKQMQDYASSLQNVTTFGDETIIKSQALLLTFTKLGNDIFPRAQEAILDVATAMGTDLNSATLQIGKALNDPVLGLTALSRSGIQFSETQKKVIKEMTDTGRVADAQRIILGELETQFGGSARAARDTLGGALASLKNAFGDLLEGDGGGEGVNGAKEAIEELITVLNDPNTKAAFGVIVAGVMDIITVMSKGVVMFADFGKALGEALGQAVMPDLDRQIDSARGHLQELLEEFHKPRLLRVNPFISSDAIGNEIETVRKALDKLEAQRDFLNGMATIGSTPDNGLLHPSVPVIVSDATDKLKELTKEQTEAAKAAKALWEGNQRTVDGLQLQADTLGWTSEAVQLYKLKLDGATASQLATAEAALATVAAYERQAEAQKEMQRLQDEAGSALNSLRGRVGATESPLGRLEAEVAARKEIYDNARAMEVIDKVEHDRLMLDLEMQASAERRRILEEETAARQESALSTMASITQITQSQVTQMQGLFNEASGVGQAFFVLSQGLAAANAIIGGFQAAMAIRVAYAQMAAMAGPGAPAILAVGESHASLAQGMGFATAGMIAAQTVASFDGGGFTGYGSRSGGIDGKGGFAAVLHPNETVIDHTKGQTMQTGQQVTNNFILQGRPDNRTQSQISQTASRSQRIANARLG